MTKYTHRSGYIFLMSVLLVGALALMATVSLLFASWSDEQNAVRFTRSSQALELARSCMDIAAYKARSKPAYTGGETVTLPTGTCDILTIQGGENSKRVICTRGTSGNVSKMLLSVFTQLYAETKISTYKEIVSASECVLPS